MRYAARAAILLGCVLALAYLGGRGWERYRASQARAFAADYYRWYPGFLASENSGASFAAPFDVHPDWFSPQLAQAWKAAVAARAQCHAADSLALDFDPFHGLPGTAASYEAGTVTRQDDGYRVSIVGVTGSKSAPALEAQVEREAGHWVFSNFFYPPTPDDPSDDVTVPHDLLTTLQARANCSASPN